MAVRRTYAPQFLGDVEINPIIKDKEFFSKGRLFAHVRLLKGQSVDWHTHTGEIEYYYIISGRGIFTNSDKSVQMVATNDVCTMTLGGGHAIRQAGEEPLEFIALIINTD
jgi:mannose-6-phosphate isomerase-like protein (cupin superfamily)